MSLVPSLLVSLILSPQNKENHMPIASTDDPRETPVTPQWESPTFIEVHMDAEIGSYQADEDERD
jgi:hypothetical protein